MRNTAREAALNVVFAQQFNTDYVDALKKKIFKQFKLEKEDDVLFAADLVATVEEHRAELINGIEDACHHYREDCTHDSPKIYDPRHFKEISGKVTHVSGLSGTWAGDTSYGNKLNSMCENIVNTKTEGQEEVERNVESDEMSIIEKIKTRILGGRRKEKIEYIRNLLFDKKNKKSMKEQIRNKIKT